MYTSTATYENKPDTINLGVNTDHLGNVRAVVSDIRQPVDNDGDGETDEYQADVKFYADYYPFGMLQPGRSFNAGDYRFGFGGQESDDEISGTAKTHYSYTYRMHDARIGRFWSIDPMRKKHPDWTPYLFAGNTPIWGREKAGLDVDYSTVQKSSYIGIGQAGYGYMKGEGIAKDEVGVTFYKFKAKPKIESNESLIGLTLFSASASFGTDYSSDLFQESMEKSPITSIGAGYNVLSASIDARDGDTYIGGSYGFAIGAGISTFETDIEESFSMTKSERNDIMSQIKEKHNIVKNEGVQFFRYEGEEGQSLLGYKVNTQITTYGGSFQLSTEYKTDIEITNVSEDDKSLIWQTENYQEASKKQKEGG